MGVVSVAPRPFFQRVIQWTLDFPLFYKILLANTALVVGALAGFWWGRDVAVGHERTVPWEFAVSVVAPTLLATMAVNYILLRASLQPVAILTRLVSALRQGETDARAQRPLFGDRETNLLIQTTNTLLDELARYRSRVSEMSERVTAQLETERKNIARELHDETAQNLVALLVLEQMLATATSEEERATLVHEARQLTHVTLDGVRRMSLGLRPAILDDVGLPGAIRWYVEELLPNVLPEAKLEVDESLGRLPRVAELALYRIAQEALSNVARHAGARNVKVRLLRDGSSVLLQVTDDGKGFEPAAPSVRSREHLGLFTIRERARLAGGEAVITSHPGQGTTVLARLPLQER